MAGSLLLDTNVIIAYMAGDAAADRLVSSADEVFVPVVAIGELHHGALKSGRVAENVLRLEEFASAEIVLPCDVSTAWHYGEIKIGLTAKGRPIPENDIWIAAIARQFGLTVASFDHHFQEVDQIEVVFPS